MKRYLLPLLAVVGSAGDAHGELVARSVEYRHGETVLEGFLACRGEKKEVMPGVLVVHDWNGLGDFAMERARRLAELGYVAFAVDMYGKGVRAKTPEEAAALATKYKSDRRIMRDRVLAGLEVLRKNEKADPGRLAAIGYCFGGTTVLELARSGADVAGVVSFHGGLGTPDPSDARNIKAKVMVLHGADDPLEPPAEVAAFQDEMRNSGVDWQMIFYGGAVHAFTNPAVGNDPARGVAYNERADKRSWEAMKVFFQEIFR